MAQLSVKIGGRDFRLACNPGEEAHLESLAHALDRKITEMRGAFGEIGDQRLVVMAALTIADEASEARRAAARDAARAEAATLAAEATRRDADLAARSLTQALDEMSFRLESMASALGARKAAD